MKYLRSRISCVTSSLKPNRSDKAPVTRLKNMAKRLGTQLFVSRLSPYTTNQKLEKLFSPFGIVKEARLVRDSITQKPKGFGFVTFESEDEAQKALKTMNGRMIDGGLIFVEVAKSSEPRDDDSS